MGSNSRRALIWYGFLVALSLLSLALAQFDHGHFAMVWAVPLVLVSAPVSLTMYIGMDSLPEWRIPILIVLGIATNAYLCWWLGKRRDMSPETPAEAEARRARYLYPP